MVFQRIIRRSDELRDEAKSRVVLLPIPYKYICGAMQFLMTAGKVVSLCGVIREVTCPANITLGVREATDGFLSSNFALGRRMGNVCFVLDCTPSSDSCPPHLEASRPPLAPAASNKLISRPLIPIVEQSLKKPGEPLRMSLKHTRWSCPQT